MTDTKYESISYIVIIQICVIIIIESDELSLDGGPLTDIAHGFAYSLTSRTYKYQTILTNNLNCPEGFI